MSLDADQIYKIVLAGGEAEMRAQASDAYKAHLTSLALARKAWLHAEVRWKSAVMLADLRRSEESTARAEMTMR